MSRLFYSLFSFVICSLLMYLPDSYADGERPETIQLSLGRQLFLDDRLLDPEMSEHVQRQYNTPHTLRRVLKQEMPWEALGFIFYCSVVDHDGTAMLYYGAYDSEKQKHFCLATSEDGLTWKRPELKLSDYQESKLNNIFPFEAVEAGVFLDPHASAEKRFRLLHNRHWPDPARAGVYLSSSADGIHWEQSDVRLFPRVPDSQPSGCWDPQTQEYAVYLRAWDPKRSICRVAVKDIETPWPYDTQISPLHVWGKEKVATISRELPIVMRPDDRDPENVQLYTSNVFRYPWAENAYFAFPAAYFLYHGPQLKERALNRNDGAFDVQLAVSRDGIHWDRQRDAWIQPEFIDDLQLQLVSMGTGMIRRGRELHQYFVGWPHTHGRPVVWDRDLKNRAEWLKRDLGGIYCATSRLDGFVSMDAGNETGVLTTNPLTITGSQLKLNIDVSGTGIAAVAVLDAAGNAIPGFTAADCEAIHADSVDFPVKWSSGHQLKELAGKSIRLQFQLRHTKLYAMEFTE
ncbi:hypothetical protein [Gimesia sp.]|uniref:hypothetical protein n=1 Tax=Gimesia sp. TaxID=2024833 RepID=UPI003A8E0E6E